MEKPRDISVRLTHPAQRAFNATYLRALRPTMSDREMRQAMLANRAGQAAAQAAAGMENQAVANWRRAANRRKGELWHSVVRHLSKRARDASIG